MLGSKRYLMLLSFWFSLFCFLFMFYFSFLSFSLTYPRPLLLSLTLINLELRLGTVLPKSFLLSSIFRSPFEEQEVQTWTALSKFAPIFRRQYCRQHSLPCSRLLLSRTWFGSDHICSCLKRAGTTTMTFSFFSPPPLNP